MKIRFLFLGTLFLFCVTYAFSQSGTFDFETTNGAASSGSPLQVTQTVGSPAVTATVSSSGVDVDFYSPGITGISGNTATCYEAALTISIAFNRAVNIRTLKAYESTSQTGTLSFAPTGGTNSSVLNQAISVDQGKLITLNWVGVTKITVTGSFASLWGFDDIVMDASLSPVELTSFTARQKESAAQLIWATATEVNNYGFEVERRAEGQTSLTDWKNLAFVSGNGTSNIAHSYSYTDAGVTSGTYVYRLKQVDNNGTSAYSSEAEITIAAPKTFALNQNYPNPFNPSTVISFTLVQDGFTTLRVYDILGREVATLVNGGMKAGVVNMATFNASKFSSGVYFSRLESSGSVQMRKLMLVK